MNNIDKAMGDADKETLILVYHFASLWQNYTLDLLKHNNAELSKAVAEVEEVNAKYKALPWYKQLFFSFGYTGYYAQKKPDLLDFFSWLTKEVKE